MRDTLSIGPTPSDESCQQVPYEDPQLARKECNTFIEQLRREFGNEPQGAYLFVARERHDFGSYFEVAVGYDSENKAAVDYAYNIEAHCPLNWDAVAVRDLELSL